MATTPARNPHRKRSKFGRKAGLAPGTITYVGEVRSFKVFADVIRYNTENLEEHKNLAPETIPLADVPGQVQWINVTGIHDIAAIERIGQQWGIHSLVLEDIVHTEQRPKIDDYDNYLYVVVRMIDYDTTTAEISSEQLSIILKGDTILSFIEDNGDLFDKLRERLRKGNVKLRKSGADYLLYSLLDVIVDHYFVVLEKIGDRLEELEMRLLGNALAHDMARLHHLKRELIFLRKSIWPMREVVGLLSKSETGHLQGNTGFYMRDVYDHCVHAIDTLETYRDLTSGLMDIYLTSLSNRMNRVMKTLTIIATIFIPLTFIVGVYGMNFDYMPELHVWWAYPAVWGVMLIITTGMLWYFKKKRWY